jgi:hypothetical protein
MSTSSPSSNSSKWKRFQKNYNDASKNIVKMLGANITLFICMCLPLLLIGFIWTDFGMIVYGPRLLSDGIITVITLVIGEMMTMRIGAEGGKLDVDYLQIKKDYKNLVEEVHSIGTRYLPLFCEWQIDLEMKQAINARLRLLRCTASEFENMQLSSYKDLKTKYGRKKARRINKLRQLDPIELDEGTLLFDSDTDGRQRGGVPMSGDVYINKKSYLAEMVLTSLFMGFLTVSIAFSLTKDINFARVVYTIFKVLVLLFRMARGYDRGARAYHTVEARRIQAKSNFLRLYKSFINEKLYVELEPKYNIITA